MFKTNLKSIAVFIFLLFFPVLVFSQEAGNIETVSLYRGIQYDYSLPSDLRGKKLKFQGSYKKYTGLDYNMAEGIIRFTPRRVGVGALNIKNRKGKIVHKLTLRVGKTALQQVAMEIQSLLKTVDGIQIKILNNKVVVDGQIIVPRDMRRIHDVVREYAGKATSLVTLSPLAQKKVAKFIEKEINDPNITVKVTNQVFILEGVVESGEEKKRAEVIAQLYLPDNIAERSTEEGKVRKWLKVPFLNHIKVKEKQQDDRKSLIQLIVHYVELNKDYANSFRFQWTPQIEDGTKFTYSAGGQGLGAVAGIISGTINNFLPKLNWAKSFGFARILHSANILTEEGEPATINSQKVVTFQATVGQQGEQSVQTYPTGIGMTMTPQIVGPRKNSVQLKAVNFIVENLVGASGGQAITTKRQLNTTIHVQDGLSAVIGGIISNSTISDYNREPPIGSTSPLFSFLSSKKFARSQSQFVVFVTPVIKTSASSGVKRIKQKFKISK